MRRLLVPLAIFAITGCGSDRTVTAEHAMSRERMPQPTDAASCGASPGEAVYELGDEGVPSAPPTAGNPAAIRVVAHVGDRFLVRAHFGQSRVSSFGEADSSSIGLLCHGTTVAPGGGNDAFAEFVALTPGAAEITSTSADDCSRCAELRSVLRVVVVSSDRSRQPRRESRDGHTPALLPTGHLSRAPSTS